MSYIGSAYLNVTPKFPNISATVKKELEKAVSGLDPAASGKRYGAGFGSGVSSGLVKSGAAIGVFSAVTSAAMSSISSHVGDAVSRFDTLNQYPKTMELLGYSAEDADESISKMSDRLQTLPTRLDDMTGMVQGIVAITGDLDQATDAGLALNDMLVASGSSTQLTTAAMEQFRQMLAKGKPEMEDWKSLTSAMPGQMQQLAEAMLGPEANANDLYYALGGGGSDPTITMDELLEARIRLDNEGGDGITSFREQAETAAGGIQTSISNMQNAITKGLAGTLDAIGKDNISGVFNGIKDAINGVFSTFNGLVSAVAPGIASFVGDLAPMAPQLMAASAAFGAVSAGGSKVSGIVQGVSERFADLAARTAETGKAASTLDKANALLGTSFTPVSLGITAAAVAAGALVAVLSDVAAEAETTRKLEVDLAEATFDAGGAWDEASASAEGAGESIAGIVDSAGAAADKLDAHRESMAALADEFDDINVRTRTQVSSLESAQDAIEAYTGKTDLSAAELGKLKNAVATVNDQCGTNYEVAKTSGDGYQIMADGARVAKDEIYDLIEAQKLQAQIDSNQEKYQKYNEELQGYIEDRRAVQSELNDVNAELAKYEKTGDVDRSTGQEIYRNTETGQLVQYGDGSGFGDLVDSADKLNGSMAEANKNIESAQGNMEGLEGQTGMAAQAADGLVTGFREVAYSSGAITSFFKGSEEDTKAFANNVRDSGISLEQFKAIAEDPLALEDLLSSYEAYGGGVDGATLALRDLGYEAGSTKEQLLGTIGGMSGLTEELEGAGIDVDVFAQKLHDAGVSTEQLNAIGSENLAALAQSCGGDMDMMMWFIQNYNNTPLVDKDGTVNLDDAELIDAQGNVYTWNGTEFVDKNGKAVVEDQQLIDAQGHVYTWNGTNLQYKSSTGKIFDLMSNGIKQRDEWNRSGLKDYYATGTISIFQNITRTVSEVFHRKNAAGGIRLNAAGGIRAHADGAVIATSAVPLDIVGEDGAEAIVPLTNRRYSQPFVDLIAEGVAEKAGKAGTYVNQTFNTRVVRSNEDLYVAASILNGAAMRYAGVV